MIINKNIFKEILFMAKYNLLNKNLILAFSILGVPGTILTPALSAMETSEDLSKVNKELNYLLNTGLYLASGKEVFYCGKDSSSFTCLNVSSLLRDILELPLNSETVGSTESRKLSRLSLKLAEWMMSAYNYGRKFYPGLHKWSLAAYFETFYEKQLNVDNLKEILEKTDMDVNDREKVLTALNRIYYHLSELADASSKSFFEEFYIDQIDNSNEIKILNNLIKKYEK